MLVAVDHTVGTKAGDAGGSLPIDAGLAHGLPERRPIGKREILESRTRLKNQQRVWMHLIL